VLRVGRAAQGEDVDEQEHSDHTHDDSEGPAELMLRQPVADQRAGDSPDRR
jgi:hypothetical protein